MTAMIMNEAKIRDIHPDKLREHLKIAINQLYMDFNQPCDDDTLNHAVSRIFERLRGKYRELMWGQIIYAFEAGVEGRWHKTDWLNVANITRWLSAAYQEIAKARFDENELKDLRYKKLNKEELQKNNICAKALQLRWKNPKQYRDKSFEEMVEIVKQKENITMNG